MIARFSFSSGYALACAVTFLFFCPLRADSIGQSLPESGVNGLQKETPDELNKQASLLAESGKLDEALNGFARALESYRQAGDQAGEAKALTNIGYVYSARSEWNKARESYTQALGWAAILRQ